jgi:sugar lactone lactonase YvrE
VILTSKSLRRAALATVAACSVVGAPSSCPALDELLVADRATDRIIGFDPTTGAQTRVLVSSGLSGPSGLAFGPDGFLYVTNINTATVVKVDPATGAVSPYVTLDPAFGPGGLAYDPASNTMFVSEFGQFNGDEVLQFDAAGSLVRTIGIGSQGSGRAGMAIRNGDLYVSSFAGAGFFAGSVLKFDHTTNFALNGIADFDQSGVVGAGDLSAWQSAIGTSDADANFDGNSDGADFVLWQRDLGHPSLTVASDPMLGGANGIAFDSSGKLYVAGLFSQANFKFDISGGRVSSGQPFGTQMAYPSGVTVQNDGGTDYVYFTSLGNDNPSDPIYGNMLFPGAVYKFDAATGALVGSGPLVASAASFQPTAVVVYSPPMGGAAAVPEPVSGVLFAWGLFALANLRRRGAVA